MINNYIKKIKKYFLEIDIKTFTLLSIVIILIIVAFIYPKTKRMLIISIEAENLKNSITIQQSTGDLEEITNSYEKYETKLNLLNQAMIAKNRELEFITTLENIATRFKLQQKININQSENIDSSNYAKIPLSVSLNGEFKNEIEYLQSIEKLSIYINVKKISITTAKEENTATATKMIILADTFWQ